MKGTIIYIHGFRSDSESSTFKKLKDLLSDYNVVTCDFSSKPEKVIQQIKDLIWENESEPFYFLGSSLGGFYSIWAGIFFNCKSFAINPSIRCFESLLDQVGEHKTFNLNLDYNVTTNDCEVLKGMYNSVVDYGIGDNVYVHINEDDEIINFKNLSKELQQFNVTKYKKGGHRPSNLLQIINNIKKELNYDSFVM